MNSLIRVIELKKELDLLRPLKKEDEQRIMQKFRLDWNYHSNNIEGNSLTYGETKALLLFGITAQGKPLKDHYEVTGHNDAIELAIDIIKKKRPLTENFIRELHSLILKESYEVDALTPEGKPTKKKVNVGEYKLVPNHVKTKTGEIFRFASPEETPAKMNDLINWYRESLADKNKNSILLASEFHYRFIRIHPFDDGNGRTARVLMNFILMQFGFPPVIIKTQDKENYISALMQADAGMLEPFVEYIAKNLITSIELMIKGAKGESVEEPDDLDKEIALLEQKLNTIGKPIKALRTKYSIAEVYEYSVIPLIFKFMKKGKLLDKFYAKKSYSLSLDNSSYYKNLDEKFLKSLSKDIKENTSIINFLYRHNAFSHDGFEEFSYVYEISFNFNVTRYDVAVKGLSFKKLYNEQLTEEEINQLVNSEIRRHKETIEEKIETIKKQK